MQQRSVLPAVSREEGSIAVAVVAVAVAVMAVAVEFFKSNQLSVSFKVTQFSKKRR